MRTVSILLPTTGRPDRAEECIRQLRRRAGTGEDVRLEVIAAVDQDPETATRIAPIVDKLIVSPQMLGCSAGWNNCLAESTGSEIVFAADDLVWGEDWLAKALDHLEAFDDGWGFVGFNDGHWDGNDLSTHYLLSRRFVIEVLGGVVAWEFYEHSFNDVEVNDRAKRAGRFIWAEDVLVYHAHWSYGDRPQDETDQRLLHRHSFSAEHYYRRRDAGYPIDYDPVIVE